MTIHDTQADEAVAFIGILGGAVRDLSIKRADVEGGSCTAILAGFMAGDIRGVSVSGSVSSGNLRDKRAAGLACGNGGTIERSNADVSVTLGSGTNRIPGALPSPVAAALVAMNRKDCNGCGGVIIDSYATGSVVGGDNAYVGGIAGYNSGPIFNSYAKVSVSTGNGGFAGGLVGSNETYIINPEISASYSTGTVTGGNGAMVGGLIGRDIALPDDPGITGLTTNQFTSGLPAGFDPSIWKEKAKKNQGYPYQIDNGSPKK